MGKGRKAKITKRLKSSKAKLYDSVLQERCERLNKNLKLVSKGFQFRIKQKKNAFLFPNDPEAEFPQQVPEKKMDYRSSKNPFSGMEQRGMMRSKTRPNDILMAKLAGEENEETIKMKQFVPKKNEIDVEILNNLLDIQINPTNSSKRKILKRRNDSRKKWKKVACKKSRHIIKF